jgi:hypothetical protein
MKLPPLESAVLVNWLDTTTYSGWQYVAPGVEYDFSPRKMQSLGWLTGVNPVAILVTPTLAPADSQDGKVGHLDPLVIPRGCIISIRRVPCG